MTIAPDARAWLRTTKQARVLHVFERACDLISDQGEVLSLVAQPLGNGPFSLVLPSLDFRETIDASSPVRIDADTLALGDLAILTGVAEVWNPRPAWEDLRRLAPRFREVASHLLDTLGCSAPPGSLAALLVPQPPEDSQLSILTLHAARTSTTQLVDGLRRGEKALSLEAAGKLAGLGGGLTPQGDDFILGCCLAVWAGLSGPQALAFLPDLGETVAARTHPLSAAWIRSAVQGLCGEPWHQLFEAFIQADLPELRTAAKRLVRVGHTSGADALAGFLSVLLDPSQQGSESAET